jgi:hypothetical protein
VPLSFTTCRSLIGGGVLASIIVAAAVPALGQAPPTPLASPSAGFVENRGQWGPGPTFRGSFGPLDVWLQNDGWTLAVEERTGFSSGPQGPAANDAVPRVTTRGVVVRMRLDGAAGASVVAVDRLDARHNWFVGSDPTKWVTDVPSFRQVKLAGLYPGVTAVAREDEGRFEYDLVLEPGADAGAVRFDCKGQDALFVENGELVMRTRFGDLRHTAPVAWEETEAGGQEPVPCSWRVYGEGRCGFVTPLRDLSRRLVIDPGIVWSTLFGGAQDENPNPSAIAMSANGNVNVAGVAVSTTFPTTVGAYQTVLQGAGTWDNFVSRFNPAGALVWSTFLGGSGWERARDIAVGPGDQVTIVGSTSSSNFPMVAAFDSSFNGNGPQVWGDAFLARFNPAAVGLAQLTWCTFLGGASDDRLNSVEVDAAGIVTASGWSYSFNCPGITPPNAFQLFQGFQDGMIARFNPALSGNAQLTWFTFLGGSTYDYLGRMAVAPGGQVIVQGGSLWDSLNYPLVNPFQATHGGGAWDVTVAVFDPLLPGANQLLYSTYLGGPTDEIEGGVALDGLGRITVAGWTASSTFPTTPGAYDTSWNGAFDAFVTRLDPVQPPASQLVYSTFVGGMIDEGINDFVLDPAGGVRAVGSVNSMNFPTTPGSYQPTFQGGSAAGYGPYDGFVFTLNPSGSALWYSSYLGGTASYDFAYAITRNLCGNVFISGITRSSDFPATSGSYVNADDAFLLQMELLPTGATRYGFPTAGCAGALEIGVNSLPVNGNAGFVVACSGAPQSSPSGVLGVSAFPLGSPMFVSGLAVWIDLASPSILTFPASSNASGLSVVGLPLPAGLAGLTGFLQFGWPDSCAPGGLSGTCGMQVVIQ